MVGFRFTVIAIAKGFKNLTGYVKNMEDGQVEVLAEADEPTFKQLMREIQASDLRHGITNTDIKTESITKRSFKAFEISF